MKYQKTGNKTYVICLAPGEEVIEKINEFLDNEKIVNAYFFGIGAFNLTELAHYSVADRKYSSKVFEEPLEVANLTGNAYLYEGKPLVHAHATMGNQRFETLSGHLVKGVVSAACEIVLVKLESGIQKKYSGETGLKLLSID